MNPNRDELGRFAEADGGGAIMKGSRVSILGGGEGVATFKHESGSITIITDDARIVSRMPAQLKPAGVYVVKPLGRDRRTTASAKAAAKALSTRRSPADVKRAEEEAEDRAMMIKQNLAAARARRAMRGG